jgi:hypothetical protein
VVRGHFRLIELYQRSHGAGRKSNQTPFARARFIASAKMSTSSRLAIAADRPVKGDGRDDGVVIGGRMRADESRVGGSYFVRKRVGGVRGDYAATTYPRPRSAACGNTNP